MTPEPFHRSKDKDPNIWRSAVNRFMEDHGGTRVLLGSQINTIIKRYRDLQLMRRQARGEETERPGHVESAEDLRVGAGARRRNGGGWRK
eukprot:SAG22_NODE_2461_length_2544_cov_2.351329_2_plen_90_part_00